MTVSVGRCDRIFTSFIKQKRDRICNLSRTIWGRVKCDRVFNDLAVYLADA
ncbi:MULTISPECIES: hypothetical protein [Cyanophyceae]|uniref:hypothetical protein n=1 Tax=Cyanophyceae TaxID=3028117 RepID=UPI001683AB7A|nr:hypothetical protein [Trichocoleus sp. FACHB-40]MBD2003227.1 hypothetical protein [Trichocoleus sp. FACHB-40]